MSHTQSVPIQDYEANTVYVEHCEDCQSHAWCTSHNQAKYESFGLMGKSIVDSGVDLSLISQKGDRREPSWVQGPNQYPKSWDAPVQKRRQLL